MENSHGLKDEALEDSTEGKHSPQRNIPQGDKEQRLGQGVNPSQVPCASWKHHAG